MNNISTLLLLVASSLNAIICWQEHPANTKRHILKWETQTMRLQLSSLLKRWVIRNDCFWLFDPNITVQTCFGDSRNYFLGSKCLANAVAEDWRKLPSTSVNLGRARLKIKENLQHEVTTKVVSHGSWIQLTLTRVD